MDNQKKQLGSQLLKYFDGDKSRVKQLSEDCKTIGFQLGENIQSIQKNPEHFALLITYSDLGILNKLANSLNKLKEK